MKNIISGSVIALLLTIALPASAEVGGTITRQAGAQVTLNTIVVAVLELLSWESPVGTITFDEGRYSANAGCNNIFGAYTVDGTTIDFGIPAATLMYCDGKMENEASFVSALDTTTHMMFKDGKLILSHGTSTLHFTPTLTTTSSTTGK